MLDPTNHGAFYFRPVDALVKLLVHQADGADIVPADEVQAKRYLRRRLQVVGLSNDAFYRIA